MSGSREYFPEFPIGFEGGSLSTHCLLSSNIFNFLAIISNIKLKNKLMNKLIKCKAYLAWSTHLKIN